MDTRDIRYQGCAFVAALFPLTKLTDIYTVSSARHRLRNRIGAVTNVCIPSSLLASLPPRFLFFLPLYGMALTRIHSRSGGMIAPILGGVLLLFSRAAPVYTSMVTFVFAAGCVLLLSEDAGEGGRSRAARRVKVVVH